jgi:hypothetical protein
MVYNYDAKQQPNKKNRYNFKISSISPSLRGLSFLPLYFFCEELPLFYYSAERFAFKKLNVMMRGI